jgi:hypothetical protein
MTFFIIFGALVGLGLVVWLLISGYAEEKK